MTQHQADDVKKFPKATEVRYYPYAGYHNYGKGPNDKYIAGRVLGHIKHNRLYDGPQIILVYFPEKNKSRRVRAYKLVKL